MQEAQKHRAGSVQKQMENIKSPKEVAWDMRIRQAKTATWPHIII